MRISSCFCCFSTSERDDDDGVGVRVNVRRLTGVDTGIATVTATARVTSIDATGLPAYAPPLYTDDAGTMGMRHEKKRREAGDSDGEDRVSGDEMDERRRAYDRGHQYRQNRGQDLLRDRAGNELALDAYSTTAGVALQLPYWHGYPATVTTTRNENNSNSSNSSVISIPSTRLTDYTLTSTGVVHRSHFSSSRTDPRIETDTAGDAFLGAGVYGSDIDITDPPPRYSYCDSDSDSDSNSQQSSRRSTRSINHTSASG